MGSTQELQDNWQYQNNLTKETYLDWQTIQHQQLHILPGPLIIAIFCWYLSWASPVNVWKYFDMIKSDK